MSQYHILTKNTDELVDKDWYEFTTGFNIVFKKQFSVDHFKTKYFGSSLGYSVHGILYKDDMIVGIFSAIPRQYIVKGKEITIALGCDAFILKEHRKDEYFLKEMADVVTTKLKEVDVNHFISIPNKTAYPYWIFYGGWKDIGKLNYYILPLKISKFLGKYKFLDFFSFHAVKTIISFSSFFNLSKKKENKVIHLIRDQNYLDQRFNSEYIIRQNFKECNFVYRIYQEENIRMVYIIDCFPISKSNIAIALKQIIKETKGNIDAILFVGKINNPPFFFLKVPEKKEPRVQPFIGLSLDNSIDDDFFSMDSWEVSLANFDNR